MKELANPAYNTKVKGHVSVEYVLTDGSTVKAAESNNTAVSALFGINALYYFIYGMSDYIYLVLSDSDSALYDRPLPVIDGSLIGYAHDGSTATGAFCGMELTANRVGEITDGKLSVSRTYEWTASQVPGEVKSLGYIYKPSAEAVYRHDPIVLCPALNNIVGIYDKNSKTAVTGWSQTCTSGVLTFTFSYLRGDQIYVKSTPTSVTLTLYTATDFSTEATNVYHNVVYDLNTAAFIGLCAFYYKATSGKYKTVQIGVNLFTEELLWETVTEHTSKPDTTMPRAGFWCGVLHNNYIYYGFQYTDERQASYGRTSLDGFKTWDARLSAGTEVLPIRNGTIWKSEDPFQKVLGANCGFYSICISNGVISFGDETSTSTARIYYRTQAGDIKWNKQSIPTTAWKILVSATQLEKPYFLMSSAQNADSSGQCYTWTPILVHDAIDNKDVLMAQENMGAGSSTSGKTVFSKFLPLTPYTWYVLPADTPKRPENAGIRITYELEVTYNDAAGGL